MTKGEVRRRWGVILTLAAVFGTAAVALVLGRLTLFPGAIDRGRAAYDRGDWVRASALASSRLKEIPADREAVRLLARASARRGHGDSALALYSRLGGASAMQGEDFFLFGRLIDRKGDHETARASWVAGLQSDPKNAEILNEFVRLYLQGSQLDLAERTAKALAARPGWQAKGEVYLGRIALERDDPEAAASHLARALDLDPAVTAVPERPEHGKRGQAPGLQSVGRDSRTHGAGSQSPFSSADTPHSCQKLLARALLRAGRSGEAATRLRNLLVSGPDPEAYWLLSRAALQEGKLADAAEALARSGSYREAHPLEPDPSPYVGSRRCASCHHDVHKEEQDSLHARTFQRAPSPQSIPVPAGPLVDPAAAAVKHAIVPEAKGVRYSTDEQGRTLRALVEYVFGSGHHGLTLVGRDDSGRMRELRLSHYADGPSWDVTTGHSAVPPRGEDYLGRILSPDDLYSCFVCHTTAPQPAHDGRGPTAADRGIGCERCHGPGANHLKAVATKFSDLSIAQPRVASGAEVIALCGQCHSPFHRTLSPIDAVAPRFPATTLTWSRCYTESRGTFDCRTCHDPHRDLATSAAHYEAKCRSCHSASNTATVCTVDAQKGCVSCHMPKTKIGVPHAVFTDHHIRVHARDSRFKIQDSRSN
jgi:tetratricopeptide (TPR) repeat protein